MGINDGYGFGADSGSSGGHVDHNHDNDPAGYWYDRSSVGSRDSGSVGSGGDQRQRRCFVATAVYGDINAPEVQVLRDFRDNVLMETGLGRKAVDLYYSGIGERVADFIRTQAPSLIPLIKKGLDRLVRHYQAHK